MQPISFATNTVTARVSPTTSATEASAAVLPSSMRSISMTLPKAATESVMPHSSATRVSFQITLKKSEGRISLRARPRITVTDA